MVLFIDSISKVTVTQGDLGKGLCKVLFRSKQIISQAMALSTMRLAMRHSLLACNNSQIMIRTVPMTSAAQKQMKEFWNKNQKLKRPSSPWIVYMPHLPMITSLTHRVTGIGMGVALYGISIGLFLAPGDFTSIVGAVSALGLSPLIMFPAKTILAFPLVYHYINGIRHLLWDVGYGYKLSTQYKTGTVIYITAVAIAGLFGSLSYWS